MKAKTSCYDCMWHTDKCKNIKSNQYNKFLNDIKECNRVGKVDNSLGCSWNELKEEDI